MTSISHFFDGEILSELSGWLSLDLSRMGREGRKGGTSHSETPGDAAEHEDVIVLHIRKTDEFTEPSPAVNRSPPKNSLTGTYLTNKR